MKPTDVTKMAKRSQIVSLRDWLTEDGEAAQVLCTEIGGEAACRITGVLPGERPIGGLQGAAPPTDEEIGRLLDMAPELIELGTALAGPDGEVRPAFHFGGTRHPLSLDGRKLSEPDLLLLVVNVLRVNGYVGGAVEASFRLRNRTRVDDGDGAVELLHGHGADAARGPA